MDSFLEKEDEEAPAVLVVGKRRRRRRRSPAAEAALQPPLHLPFLPLQPGKGGAFVRSLCKLLRGNGGTEFRLLSSRSSASAGREV